MSVLRTARSVGVIAHFRRAPELISSVNSKSSSGKPSASRMAGSQGIDRSSRVWVVIARSSSMQGFGSVVRLRRQLHQLCNRQTGTLPLPRTSTSVGPRNV